VTQSAEPPVLECERRAEERGAAARGWLRRLLACWLIFQTITAVTFFNLLTGSIPWSGSLAAQVALAPGTLLMAFFAGWAAVTAVRGRSVLARRWFVAGLVPWGLLVVQGTAVLVSMWV
jgi:hypothetical protein